MKKRNIGLVTNSGSSGWSNFNELSYVDIINLLKIDYFYFRVSDPMSNGHIAEYREILKTWKGEKVKTVGYIDCDKVVFDGRIYYFPESLRTYGRDLCQKKKKKNV